MLSLLDQQHQILQPKVKPVIRINTGDSLIEGTYYPDSVKWDLTSLCGNILWKALQIAKTFKKVFTER
jgi:hypothetical protein